MSRSRVHSWLCQVSRRLRLGGGRSRTQERIFMTAGGRRDPSEAPQMITTQQSLLTDELLAGFAARATQLRPREPLLHGGLRGAARGRLPAPGGADGAGRARPDAGRGRAGNSAGSAYHAARHGAGDQHAPLLDRRRRRPVARRRHVAASGCSRRRRRARCSPPATPRAATTFPCCCRPRRPSASTAATASPAASRSAA